MNRSPRHNEETPAKRGFHGDGGNRTHATFPPSHNPENRVRAGLSWLHTDPLGLIGGFWHLRLIADLIYTEAKNRITQLPK